MEDIRKQAKRKALSLLTDMDRTEQQLRTKLKAKSYSDDVVEEAIDYVKSFGYVNDGNYAERFILSKQRSKSRREIYAALCERGVERDIVLKALDECYEEYDEVDTIRLLAAKKNYSNEDSSDVEKRKIYAYFLRKGFQNEDIRQVIQVSF